MLRLRSTTNNQLTNASTLRQAQCWQAQHPYLINLLTNNQLTNNQLTNNQLTNNQLTNNQLTNNQ